MNSSITRKTTKPIESSFVGRDRELKEIEKLVDSAAPKYALIFVGGPQIGKTALLGKAREDIMLKDVASSSNQTPRSLLPISLDFRDVSVQWSSVWEQLLVGLKSSSHIETYQQDWRTADRSNVFRELAQLKIQLVFLVDNFDSASEESSVTGSVSAADVCSWAQEPNVRLIATSGRGRADRSFIERPLYLLTETEAKTLVGKLLVYDAKSPDEAVTEKVLEWAGYHPFLIKSLADCIPPKKGRGITEGDVSRAIDTWRRDRAVGKHLESAWKSLDLQNRQNNAAVVLHRLAKPRADAGIPSPTPAEKLGLVHLALCGVVTEDEPKRIPSRLFREFAAQQLGMHRWYEFTSGRLVQVSFICLFLGILASALLFFFGARWGMALAAFFAAIPLIYGLYGLWTQREAPFYAPS